MSERITYHYVLALKIHVGGQAFSELESRGTLHVEPGSSRYQVYEQVRETMVTHARQQGVQGNTTTVFWSLEPDALS